MTDLCRDTSEGLRLPNPGTTSLSLLARWQQNEKDAWDRVTYLYYPLVYSWCRHRGLQPEDARDVTQEVFRALTRNTSRFQSKEGKNSFRGWLWGVTKNELKMYWRARAKHPQPIGGSDAREQLFHLTSSDERQLDEPETDADQAVIARRAMELIQTEFEPATWQAFWKAAVDGRPAREIADDLQMTTNAVYLAKSRVLKRLRTEFEDLLEM